MDHLIYTIGREFGSGGKDIGDALAQKLGIPCYDKELLARAAKDSGFCREIFENHDEKPTNSFLYSLVMDTYSVNGYNSTPFLDMPLNQKVFLAQFDTIKKLAAEGPCVIVGRCADYALADMDKCVNVFIRADVDFKIKHTVERLGISEAKAKDMNAKNDKQRASYYNYYTSKRWGDAKSYNLCLDSGMLGIDGCVEMILKYATLVYGRTV